MRERDRQRSNWKEKEVEMRKLKLEVAALEGRQSAVRPSVAQRAADRIRLSLTAQCIFSLCCLCAAACILSTNSAAGGSGASASGDSSGLLSACVDSEDGMEPLIGVCSTDDEP